MLPLRDFLAVAPEMAVRARHVQLETLVELAWTLTVAARETYEVGTVRLLQPERLRMFNECLHAALNGARGILQGPIPDAESYYAMLHERVSGLLEASITPSPEST